MSVEALEIENIARAIRQGFQRVYPGKQPDDSFGETVMQALLMRPSAEKTPLRRVRKLAEHFARVQPNGQP